MRAHGLHPAYTIVGVILILAWRNAGYLGPDHFASRCSAAGSAPAPA